MVATGRPAQDLSIVDAVVSRVASFTAALTAMVRTGAAVLAQLLVTVGPALVPGVNAGLIQIRMATTAVAAVMVRLGP